MDGIARESYSRSRIWRDREQFRGVAVSNTVERGDVIFFRSFEPGALDGMKLKLIFRMTDVLVLG